ncbi:MAG TPA: hypothetical protein VGB82_16210 [Alphaproteobacteria bacterium]
MTASHLVVLGLALAALAGCELLPLDEEIKTACAVTPDPAACAKAKYADSFSDERARVAREGFVR